MERKEICENCKWSTIDKIIPILDGNDENRTYRSYRCHYEVPANGWPEVSADDYCSKFENKEAS